MRHLGWVSRVWFHGNKLPGCQHSLQIYQSQLVGSCLGGRVCWWGKLFDPPGRFFPAKTSPLKIYRDPNGKVCLRTYNQHVSRAFAVKLLEGMNVVILMKPQKTWRIGQPFVEPKKYGRCWYRKSSYFKRWSRSFVEQKIFSSFDKSMFSLEAITARTVMINDELVVPDDIANIMSEYEWLG